MGCEACTHDVEWLKGDISDVKREIHDMKNEIRDMKESMMLSGMVRETGSRTRQG